MKRRMSLRCFRAATTYIILAFLLLAGGIYNTAYGIPDDFYQKIEGTKAEIAELQSILKALDDSIDARVERISELEKEFEETEAWLVQSAEKLALSEIKLAEDTAHFAQRVRSAYIKGGLSYVELLLEAESFGDLIMRVAYLTRILSGDANLIAAVKDEQESIRERKIAMEEQHKKLKDLRGQVDGEQRNLLDQRREKDALLVSAQKRLAGELALVTPQAERKPVYAIVLDNAPQARPQHGLSKASIVYEYEVEGRITRYLALFAEFPTKVGPIRSGRASNAILAMENDAHFIYTSAGVDVLALIKEWGVKGTDALYAKGFYRDSSRRAPHNLYTNLSTLGTVSQSQEVVIRPAFLSRTGTAATAVSLRYSPTYIVRYDYVKARGLYRRYINGQLHKDATGADIAVRNIIIQYVPHYVDLMGRPTPSLIGEGSIDYYSQGQHFKGTWKKDSLTAPTRFYYLDGQEIEKVYGQTWIQIARPQ
jgi:peptidoglycan hydrolase CwlO-like protein